MIDVSGGADDYVHLIDTNPRDAETPRRKGRMRTLVSPALKFQLILFFSASLRFNFYRNRSRLSIVTSSSSDSQWIPSPPPSSCQSFRSFGVASRRRGY